MQRNPRQDAVSLVTILRELRNRDVAYQPGKPILPHLLPRSADSPTSVCLYRSSHGHESPQLTLFLRLSLACHSPRLSPPPPHVPNDFERSDGGGPEYLACWDDRLHFESRKLHSRCQVNLPAERIPPRARRDSLSIASSSRISKMEANSPRQCALIRNSCGDIGRRMATRSNRSPRNAPYCWSFCGILVEPSAARRSPSSPIFVRRLRRKARASHLCILVPKNAPPNSSLPTNWTTCPGLPIPMASSTKRLASRGPSCAST